MNKRLGILPVAALAIVFGVASVAQATPVTLLLDSGGTASGVTVGSGDPHQQIRTWTNVGGISGLTLTATAWQLTAAPTSGTTLNSTSFVSNAATGVAAAGLGQYGGVGYGLGVTTGAETGTGNQHTLDNDGPLEFVEFTFSSPVTVTGLVLNAFALAPDTIDGDFSLAFGDVGANLASGTTYYNYNAGTTSFTTSLSSFFDVFATLRPDLGPDANNDGFKIYSITFNTTSVVPLPQSAAMGLGLLAALGGLGVWRRRRRTADLA